VEWLGWQRDVGPVIARAHLLLQTSHNEGTPVALIQGMAAARSFVATPVGGVPEMCGNHAVTCPPDAVAFADKLIELSAQPARLLAMGRNARAFASSRYSKQRLVDDLDALYRELLRKKGRQLSASAACASQSM